jgi:hypothetical protein
LSDGTFMFSLMSAVTSAHAVTAVSAMLGRSSEGSETLRVLGVSHGALHPPASGRQSSRGTGTGGATYAVATLRTPGPYGGAGAMDCSQAAHEDKRHRAMRRRQATSPTSRGRERAEAVPRAIRSDVGWFAVLF